MRKSYLLFLLGFIMACSDLPGIEILDVKVEIEDTSVILTWQVHNDSPQPLYLLNVDNPFVEQEGDVLYLSFKMNDTSNSLTLKEVPFRSKIMSATVIKFR